MPYTAEGTGTPGPATNGQNGYWDPTERATAAAIFEEFQPRANSALIAAGVPGPQAQTLSEGPARAAADTYLAQRRAGAAPGIARQAAEQAYSTGIAAVGKSNNVNVDTTATSGGPGGAGAVGANEIGDQDVQDAANVYRDVTKGALGTYKMPGGPAQPSPLDIVKPVQADPIAEAARFKAALQEGVTVAATDTTDLAATAQGQGAGQLADAARRKGALLSQGQALAGAANQARGSNRQAARIAVINAQGQAGVAQDANIAAQAAQERQAAQLKIADLDAQRKQAQANLDQAKAAGDQNAINAATQKLADLDQERAKFNSDQGVRVATTNNDQGLKAQDQQETQRVNNEDLKIRLGKAAQDAAQGLLNEAQREENLKLARRQLANAEQAYADAVRRQAAQDELAARNADRQFWGGIVSSLLSGGAQVATSAVTKSDRRAKTNVQKVKRSDLDALADAARESLATWEYKDGEGEAGEHAFPMAQDLEKTRLGKTLVRTGKDGMKEVDGLRLASLLALAAIKDRKEKGL